MKKKLLDRLIYWRLFLRLFFGFWRKLDIDEVSRIDFKTAKFYAEIVMQSRRGLQELEKEFDIKVERL